MEQPTICQLLRSVDTHFIGVEVRAVATVPTNRERPRYANGSMLPICRGPKTHACRSLEVSLSHQSNARSFPAHLTPCRQNHDSTHQRETHKESNTQSQSPQLEAIG